MKPLLYIGLLAVVAGLALTVAKPMIACEPRLKGLLWSGRIAVGMGLFFFACEGMGAILGAAPQFNLGDATKLSFGWFHSGTRAHSCCYAGSLSAISWLTLEKAPPEFKVS